MGGAHARWAADQPVLLSGLALHCGGRPPGEAEVVLLVHGLGSCTSVWDLVAPALAERFALALVDLPGHGAAPLPGEDADALLELMRPSALGARLLRACRELGVPRVHLVGHSLGGWVVLEAAAEDGAGTVGGTGGVDGTAGPVVASVTALAPPGLWTTPRRRPPLVPTGQQIARWGRRVPRSVLRRRWARRLVLAATSAVAADLPEQVALDAVAAVESAAGYRAADAGIAAGRFTRGRDVRAPATVVFGTADRVLPAACRLRAAAPPGCTWVEWDRCGHVPPWDRPADCAELVTSTVREAAREAGGGRGAGRGARAGGSACAGGGT
ncbi:alpha/beta fold hydrolase [Kineococcus sp. NUM-3379]